MQPESKNARYAQCLFLLCSFLCLFLLSTTKSVSFLFLIFLPLTGLFIDKFLIKIFPDHKIQIIHTLYYSVFLLLVPFSLKAPKGTVQNFILDLITYTGCVIFISKYAGVRLTVLSYLFKLPYQKILFFCSIISIVLYTVILGFQTTAKFNSFSMEWMDISYEFPPVWQSLRYGMLRMIDDLSIETSLLRYHWPLFYIIISPFSFFWNTPVPFLWIHTIAFTLTAITAGLLTYEYTKNRVLSYWTIIIVTLYLPMHLANLYDIHSDPFAMPFILLSFLFARKKSWKAYAVCVILALSCKEYVGLVFFGFGIWLSFKSSKAGIITSLSGLLWFLFVVKIGIPFFNDGVQPVVIYSNYSSMGGDKGLTGIVSYLMNNPMNLFRTLFRQNNISSFIFLFLPFLFLPFRSISILAAGIPIILKNALSAAGIELLVHRETLFIPFIIYGLIITVSSKKHYNRHTLISIAIACLITSLLQGHAFPSRGFWLQKDKFTVTERDKLYNEYISSIPQSSSVMISSHLSAHVMNRKWYFLFPRFHTTIKPEYILVDTLEQKAWEWLSREEQIDSLKCLMKEKEYRLIRRDKGVFLFRK